MTDAACSRGSGPLGGALADELVLASQMLGDLAYDLGGDEAVVRRHLTSLQAIDHVTQILLIAADLLRAPAIDDARLAGITLDGMAERLGRHGIAAAA